MPLIIALIVWELAARLLDIPPYLLPAPSKIGHTLISDAGIFAKALGVTLTYFLTAFIITLFIAPLMASLMHLNSRLNKYLMPFIVILQVTPLVAVIPLLMIWLDMKTAVILSAVIIAFIPLFLSVKAGFNAASSELNDLFTLLKASNWQRFTNLAWPLGFKRFRETLPLTASLTLVGTIVGEFLGGSSGGLASLLIESQYRLNSPRLFGALILIAGLGLILQQITSRFSSLRQP